MEKAQTKPNQDDRQSVLTRLGDVSYLLWFSTFVLSCAIFDTRLAPQQFNQFLKVVFFDISRQFRPSANRYFWLPQLNFSLFGALKIVYGRSQHRKVRGLYAVQGASLILLSLVNGDVSSAVHGLSTFTGIFASIFIFYSKLRLSSFNGRTKNLLLLLLNVQISLLVTVGFSYMAYSRQFSRLYPRQVCQFFYWCFNAPAFSFGFHEWLILLWLLFIDWVCSSDLCFQRFSRLQLGKAAGRFVVLKELQSKLGWQDEATPSETQVSE